jgi:uncharacterized protein (DUF1810 family)
VSSDGDPHNLNRFVTAQERVYDTVLAELRAGEKHSHWMWFIFPQIAGLGHSPTARFYAIASIDEARAYLTHPVLGPRLKTCAELVLAVKGRSVDAIFGSPDNMKFRSSMTLFSHVAPEEPVFGAALRKYFNGEPDRQTPRLLGAALTDAKTPPSN